MLKSGFKSSEFYLIGGYYLSQKFGVNIEQITGISDSVVKVISDSTADPLSQALIIGFVAFRFIMKWRENEKP